MSKDQILEGIFEITNSWDLAVDTKIRYLLEIVAECNRSIDDLEDALGR